MIIPTITITGADDAVDPQKLADLSNEFPLVEWGILVSDTRAGTPRYPSAPWMSRILNLMGGRARFAAHYCGMAMRDMAIHGLTHPAQWAKRIQLNGWSPGDSDLLEPFHGNDITPILQCRGSGRLVEFAAEAIRLRRAGVEADVLLDPSGGTGKSVAGSVSGDQLRLTAQADRFKFGLAGGIGPDNIKTAMVLAIRTCASWIDMESGVRTGDAFDLEKVREVLEKHRAFLGALATAPRSKLS